MAILGAAAAAILLLHALGSVNGELCIGNLPEWGHAVSGRFCVINETTIVIRNFYYDGAGPDAHLYWYPDGFTTSNIPRSGNGGYFIPHPNTQRDGRFPQNGYVLDATLQFSLPDGVYACDLAVFTIWCRWARSHFTGIDIPASNFTTDPNEAATTNKILCTRGMEPTTAGPTTQPTTVPTTQPTTEPPTPALPSEVCVGDLVTVQHAVEGTLCIIDQSTMVLKNFYYDTGGPDAYLYGYPVGHDPPYTSDNVRNTFRSGGGHTITFPLTGGALLYQTGFINNITFQFSLPPDVYACDLAVFTVWCQLAGVQFAVLDIPPDIFTDNISVAVEENKILCDREPPTDGNETTTDETTTDETPTTGTPSPTDFDNCERLHPSLRLEWTVDRSSESVRFRLCGCTSPDSADDNTWLGFGLSGSDSATLMIGADATIVWVDRQSIPHAEDYYLSAYIPCGGGKGACPDVLDSSGVCSNDATLISGSIDGREQCVVFSRNFTAGDACDKAIDPDNENQYIVWGVGGLGDTAFRHFVRAESGDAPLHLGRQPSENCKPLVCSSCDAYETQTLVADDNATFVARIGPSGDQRGYMGITGRAGWGIAWYINDTLIPTLVVQRGKTYTFVVYGGDDPNMNANYHPLYITNSTTGGRVFMDEQEKAMEIIYAGVEDNGTKPIGVGPLCESTSTPAAEALSGLCDALLCNYEEALAPPSPGCKDSLTDGRDNTFTWTPDDNTSDVVFYQCFTHRNLGWKIMVTDSVEDYLESNPVRKHPDPCPPPPSSTVQSSSPGVPSSPVLLLASLLLLSSLTVLVR
jgi:hypothetical protein